MMKKYIFYLALILCSLVVFSCVSDQGKLSFSKNGAYQVNYKPEPLIQLSHNASFPATTIFEQNLFLFSYHGVQLRIILQKIQDSKKTSVHILFIPNGSIIFRYQQIQLLNQKGMIQKNLKATLTSSNQGIVLSIPIKKKSIPKILKSKQLAISLIEVQPLKYRHWTIELSNSQLQALQKFIQ